MKRLAFSVLLIVFAFPFAAAQLGPEQGQDFWDWKQQSAPGAPTAEDLENEGSAYNQRQRLLNFWAPRLFPASDREVASQALVDFQAWRTNNHCDNSGFDANWEALGPFDTPAEASTSLYGVVNAKGTGQIHCIAFHPDYPATNIVYAGSGYGGLFRSTNGGAWVPLTDFLEPISAVTDVVVHPTMPTTLFIATGNVDGDGTYSAGVFRSTDDGATWESMNTGLLDGLGDYTVMRVLRMDPIDPNHLLCATSAGIYECLMRTNQAQAGSSGSTKLPVNGRTLCS